MEKNEVKSPTFRERIENHIGLYAAGLAITAFVAGFGAYPTIVSKNNENNTRLERECDWKSLAKKEDWIQKSECPSYPVDIKITSPGNQSYITFENNYSRKTLKTNLIIQSSRPILSPTTIGIVIKEMDNPNYYVAFPNFYPNENKTNFRTLGNFEIPFEPKFKFSEELKQEKVSQVSIWTLITPDQQGVGSIYSSLEQIKNSVQGNTISEKVDIFLKPK